MTCPHEDVHYLQVPAGTLISGLILEATKGSSALARILVGSSTIITLLLLLLPMCVRASTIHWFPDIARNNSITLIHNPQNADGLAGLGYGLFVFSGLINGLSLFMFVLSS